MTLILVSLALLAGGGAAAFAAGRAPRAVHLLGAGGAVGGGLVGVASAAQVLWTGARPELRLGWGGFGSITLGLDALTAFFLLPIFVLSALAAIYGAEYLRSYSKPAGPHWLFFNLLIASMVLVTLARDGLVFLVSWEAMALTSFFLVTFEDEKASVRDAGWIYLVATHLGTAFLFPFFLVLGQRAGGLTFDAMSGAASALPPGLAAACFVFAIIGFGTKAGFMPMHVWLPEAHPAAPSHVSAVMSGVMIKTGIYGLLRALSFLGAPSPWWGWLLVAIGVSSGVLGVLFALAQHDLKRLLAYHSVENIGIIAIGMGLGVLGVATHQPTLAALGFAGALLHVVNHALFKGLLFLGAGAVLSQVHTGEIDRLGGLLKRMPFTAATFLVGATAICGLPPLNGFVSEFLLYVAAFGAGEGRDAGAALSGLAVIAGLALIGGLAAACFTKAFGVVFLGEARSGDLPPASDPGWPMKLALGTLALLCVGLGLLGPWTLRVAAQALPLPPEFGAAGTLESPSRWLVGVTIAGAALWVLIGLTVLLRSWLLKGKPVTESGTWDCGYARPTARMQYSASSFADPIVRVFFPFLRTHQALSAPKGFFPLAASLETHTPDLGRERVFGPLFATTRGLLARLAFLQQGGMHRYVLFIALTLLVLLVWKL